MIGPRAHEGGLGVDGDGVLLEPILLSDRGATVHELGVELLRGTDFFCLHPKVDPGQCDTGLMISLLCPCVARRPVGRVHQEHEPLPGLGCCAKHRVHGLGYDVLDRGILEKQALDSGVEEVVLKGRATPPLLPHRVDIRPLCGRGHEASPVAVVPRQVRRARRRIPHHTLLPPLRAQGPIQLPVRLVHPEARREKRTLTTPGVVLDEPVFHRVERFDLGRSVALREVIEERAVLVGVDRDSVWVAGDNEHPALGRVEVHVYRLEQAAKEYAHLLSRRERARPLADKHVVPPVEEDRPEVVYGRPDLVLSPTGQRLHLREQIAKVKTPAVVDVGEQVEPLHQRQRQIGRALGGRYRPVDLQIQEPPDGVGRQHEALVLVSHEEHVGHHFTGLLKPFQVEDELPKHVAHRYLGLQIVVVLGLQKETNTGGRGLVLPDCIPVRPMGRGPRRIWTVVRHFGAVGVLYVLLHTGEGEGGFGLFSHGIYSSLCVLPRPRHLVN